MENVIMYGPTEKRFDAFLHQPISDYHIVERNKGFGLVVDDQWNIDWEAIWRGNIMDKYSRPYRDVKTGEWIGGYIQKRFEVDKWIPEETNMQLKPGQLRKPYLPEQRGFEARLEAMRKKEADKKGFKPDSNGEPYDWNKEPQYAETKVAKSFNLSKTASPMREIASCLSKITSSLNNMTASLKNEDAETKKKSDVIASGGLSAPRKPKGSSFFEPDPLTQKCICKICKGNVQCGMSCQCGASFVDQENQGFYNSTPNPKKPQEVSNRNILVAKNNFEQKTIENQKTIFFAQKNNLPTKLSQGGPPPAGDPMGMGGGGTAQQTPLANRKKTTEFEDGIGEYLSDEIRMITMPTKDEEQDEVIDSADDLGIDG
jgi:hypothetical protein